MREACGGGAGEVWRSAGGMQGSGRDADIDQFCNNCSFDRNAQFLKRLTNLYESLKCYDIIACSSFFLQILCRFIMSKVRYLKPDEACRLSSKSRELVY